MRALAVALLFPALLVASQGEALIHTIASSGLDPTECYRVREISLVRDEAQFYFTDGYLIFGKPVGSTRVTAVFSSDVEGGEAELLLLPPNRSERRALALHAGAPNLEEHFTAALMVFADDTYRDILDQIRANPYNKKSGEMGALLASKWNTTALNLSTSFGPRLALDLLSPVHAKVSSQPLSPAANSATSMLSSIPASPNNSSSEPSAKMVSMSGPASPRARFAPSPTPPNSPSAITASSPPSIPISPSTASRR